MEAKKIKIADMNDGSERYEIRVFYGRECVRQAERALIDIYEAALRGDIERMKEITHSCYNPAYRVMHDAGHVLTENFNKVQSLCHQAGLYPNSKRNDKLNEAKRIMRVMGLDVS